MDGDGFADGNARRLPLSNLENPTSETLRKNYTKGELQKFCQEIEIGGIWTTKEILIDKILSYFARKNGASPDGTVEDEQETTSNHEELNVNVLQEMLKKHAKDTNSRFQQVHQALAEKDKEIEELKTKLFLAEERLKTLQEHLDSRCENDLEGSKKTLLIGDSTLQEMKTSDLQEDVIIRTLPDANIRLLKSWIVEKLDCPLKECIIYCGLQDLLDENVDVDQTLDHIGTVVSELNRKK